MSFARVLLFTINNKTKVLTILLFSLVIVLFSLAFLTPFKQYAKDAEPPAGTCTLNHQFPEVSGGCAKCIYDKRPDVVESYRNNGNANEGPQSCTPVQIIQNWCNREAGSIVDNPLPVHYQEGSWQDCLKEKVTNECKDECVTDNRGDYCHIDEETSLQLSDSCVQYIWNQKVKGINRDFERWYWDNKHKACSRNIMVSHWCDKLETAECKKLILSAANSACSSDQRKNIGKPDACPLPTTRPTIKELCPDCIYEHLKSFRTDSEMSKQKYANCTREQKVNYWCSLNAINKDKCQDKINLQCKNECTGSSIPGTPGSGGGPTNTPKATKTPTPTQECTPGVFDGTLCRKCTSKGKWAAECSGYGGRFRDNPDRWCTCMNHCKEKVPPTESQLRICNKILSPAPSITGTVPPSVTRTQNQPASLDINKDGRIRYADDFVICTLEAIGTYTSTQCDLTADGKVNSQDLEIWSDGYRQ